MELGLNVLLKIAKKQSEFFFFLKQSCVQTW